MTWTDRNRLHMALRSYTMLSTILLLAMGCNEASGREPRRSIPGGDADKGKELIISYGCGSCHMVPGIREAQGTVGPPLFAWARRVYIAGEVPNTPDFLIRWIEMPQAIEPGTAMPNLGVTEEEARNMAAYLYTLY